MPWNSRALPTYAAAAGLGLCSAAALADSPSMLEEVVVTAQKRAENIQDVPIAISAYTAQDLEAKGIGDVQQLSASTPNVTFDAGTPFSGSSSVLAAYIRGIGYNDFAFNQDPGVGVYIDGVFLARSVGANTDLLDIERIEVLKGPQGTLFGRNTIGGAINIITREPAKEFGFKGDVTVGDFDRRDVRGIVDVPFSDAIRGSLSFSSKQRDGYQRRIPFDSSGDQGVADCAGLANCGYVAERNTDFVSTGYDTADKEGSQDEYNVRGKLVVEFSDRIKATFAGDYTRVDQSSMANTLINTVTQPTQPGAAFGLFYNLCINTPAAVLDTIPFPVAPFTGLNVTNGICGPRGTVITPIGGVNVDGDPSNNRMPYDDRFVSDDIDRSYATGNSFSKIKSYGYSGTLDVELSDNMQLKSITAYRDLTWSSGLDLDGSPLPMLEPSFSMRQHEFSQELQLTGRLFDERLSYAVGAYYFKESGHMNDFVTFPAGLLQIHGPNYLSTNTWALFTHLNYKLTDRFSLTVGARYTEEDKDFEGGQTDLNGFNYKLVGCFPPGTVIAPGVTCQDAVGFPVDGEPLRYFPAGIQNQKFSEFTPRIGFEFRMTDQAMLYASYSKGFKSGGWTTRLSAPIAVASDAAFGPEKAQSYEVGLKSSLFDGRARLNTAVFFTDYDDIQLNFVEGVSPTIKNGGKAEIYGFEAELETLIGAGFSLTSSIGYLHAEYTEVNPDTLLTRDEELPKTPEWKFNVGPQYELSLGEKGTLRFNADYTYTSKLYNDPENTPELRRDPVDMVNAAITYITPEKQFEFSVGGTNLTDERYIVTGQNQAAGGVVYATFSRPREWYATARFRY